MCKTRRIQNRGQKFTDFVMSHVAHKLEVLVEFLFIFLRKFEREIGIFQRKFLLFSFFYSRYLWYLSFVWLRLGFMMHLLILECPSVGARPHTSITTIYYSFLEKMKFSFSYFKVEGFLYYRFYVLSSDFYFLWVKICCPAEISKILERIFFIIKWRHLWNSMFW